MQRAFYYTQIISGCNSLGKQQISARDLYSRAKANGLLHDLLSYNSMISALGERFDSIVSWQCCLGAVRGQSFCSIQYCRSRKIAALTQAVRSAKNVHYKLF